MQNAAFGNIRTHFDGSVLVAGQRMAQKHTVPIADGKGEFQRVVEDMLVIRNLQIMPVNLICRRAVQFIQHFSFRPGHFQRRAEPPPAEHAGIHDMKIRSAQQRQYHAGRAGLRTFVEHIGREGIVAKRTAAPDRDAVRDLLLQDAADLVDRDGINGHEDLDALHPGEGVPHPAQGLPQARDIPVFDRDQTAAHKAVRFFINRAGDYQSLGRDIAFKQISRGGCADTGCVRHQLFHRGAGISDLAVIGAV